MVCQQYATNGGLAKRESQEWNRMLIGCVLCATMRDCDNNLQHGGCRSWEGLGNNARVPRAPVELLLKWRNSPVKS
jgi:hypothetical protein